MCESSLSPFLTSNLTFDMETRIAKQAVEFPVWIYTEKTQLRSTTVPNGGATPALGGNANTLPLMEVICRNISEATASYEIGE